MSRIIAGAGGGMPLVSVPGSMTRPTTDRVKEALFSRLEAFNVVAGARVLDLYAGSGSLGVESASRGAETVDLVEFDGKASEVCQRNADLVNGAIGRKAVSVHRSRVESFLERTVQGTLWDLVFLDPPYPLDEPAMGAVLARAVAVPGGGRRRGGGALLPQPGTGVAGVAGTVRREEIRRDQAVVRRTRGRQQLTGRKPGS